MYNRVSRQLRQKIEKDMQELMDEDANDLYVLSFTSDEEHLRQECIEWRHIINLYFLSSRSGGALKNFGQYKYIRPKEIANSKVTFECEINWNQSWRDWFIVKEGHDYASIVST